MLKELADGMGVGGGRKGRGGRFSKQMASWIIGGALKILPEHLKPKPSANGWKGISCGPAAVASSSGC